MDYPTEPQPTGRNPEDILDDPQIAAALEEYLKALEAGQTPSRKALLERFKDKASEVSSVLQALQLMRRCGNRFDV